MISFLAFSYAQTGLQHFSSNYHIDRSDFMVINPKVGAADMALAGCGEYRSQLFCKSQVAEITDGV